MTKSEGYNSQQVTIDKVIVDFLFHCRYERNLNEKTIYAYRSDLYLFEKYIRNTCSSVLFEQVSKDVLKGYLQYISTYKPKTVKRKLASLKALFNYYDYEHDDFLNPFRKLHIRFKEPYVLPIVMTGHEVKAILKYLYKLRAENSDTGNYMYKAQTRDIAVVELLFATGIRVSELCELTCNAIDLKQATIKVFGKGSKERVIQICSTAVLKILKQYQQQFAPFEYFFVNRLGNRLSTQSVRLLIKRCRDRTGLEKKISPHTFRHTFATLLLEEDVDIKYIQNLLGHSSITTTQIYTHVNMNKQKKLLSSKHPRKKMNLDE